MGECSFSHSGHFSTREIASTTIWLGGWLDLTACVDASEKKGFFFYYWELNVSSSGIQLIAQSPYQLNCTHENLCTSKKCFPYHNSEQIFVKSKTLDFRKLLVIAHT
jgi:hypothetical protein